jgi:hypothetical protein
MIVCDVAVVGGILTASTAGVDDPNLPLATGRFGVRY